MFLGKVPKRKKEREREREKERKKERKRERERQRRRKRFNLICYFCRSNSHRLSHALPPKGTQLMSGVVKKKKNLVLQ